MRRYRRKTKGKRSWRRPAHRVDGYYARRWGKRVWISGHLRRNRRVKRR